MYSQITNEKKEEYKGKECGGGQTVSITHYILHLFSTRHNKKQNQKKKLKRFECLLIIVIFLIFTSILYQLSVLKLSL